VIQHSSNVKIELSGGIRDNATLEATLAMGATRVVLSTSALADLDWTASAIDNHGAKIAIGLDVQGSSLTARGSTQVVGDLFEVLQVLEEAGGARYVVTDVTKDGTLLGPNLELLRSVLEKTNRPVVASGGISSLEDLQKLKELTALGLEGAILGKSLYAGRFTLKQALEIANG
jgi:phosphoribosylformimino-5-aminoimidazole carboxamide ribonucleotide (ProFAR) isomerase